MGSLFSCPRRCKCRRTNPIKCKSEKHLCCCDVYIDTLVCRSTEQHFCACYFSESSCRLHMTPVNTLTGVDETEECIICLRNLYNTYCVRLTGCKHYYHIKCIKRWLKISLSCPICRLPIDRQMLV